MASKLLGDRKIVDHIKIPIFFLAVKKLQLVDSSEEFGCFALQNKLLLNLCCVWLLEKSYCAS